MILNADVINKMSDEVAGEFVTLLVDATAKTMYGSQAAQVLDMLGVLEKTIEICTEDNCKVFMQKIISSPYTDIDVNHFPVLYHNVKYNRVDYLLQLDFSLIADECVMKLHDLAYKNKRTASY